MTFSSSSLRLRPRGRRAAGPWAKVDEPRVVVAMWVYWCASSSWALRLAAASRRASIESWGITVKTTSQSWLARQGSPEVFITYRTHGHGRLFRREGLHACLLQDPVSGRPNRPAGLRCLRPRAAAGCVCTGSRTSRGVPDELATFVTLGGLTANANIRDESRTASRDTIVMVVLGGELAVPCTRNPLQRG